MAKTKLVWGEALSESLIVQGKISAIAGEKIFLNGLQLPKEEWNVTEVLHSFDIENNLVKYVKTILLA